jgi:hypothetical protein
MALSKVNYNSLNVTPTASKFLMWDSDADALQASDVGGSLKLISTSTASSSATLNFTSGIDSTYKEYIFKFINCHPASNNVYLDFQGSTDSGSNYNTSITATFFRAYNAENDSGASLAYVDVGQGNGTSYQNLSRGVGNGNDECVSGYLHLFEPSSTTFVKHFLSITNQYDGSNSQNTYVGGYFNTTSAIDAVSFKMSSGNIDSGVIKMYGVS